MKKICLLVSLALLLCLCGACAPEEQPSVEVLAGVPQELPGVWVSASGGELELVETITFYEDGSLEVSATYQGADAGTIYGSYRVEEDAIYCSITEGVEPFDMTFTYRIDGRELTLTDGDGDAHYLRTS